MHYHKDFHGTKNEIFMLKIADHELVFAFNHQKSPIASHPRLQSYWIQAILNSYKNKSWTLYFIMSITPRSAICQINPSSTHFSMFSPNFRSRSSTTFLRIIRVTKLPIRLQNKSIASNSRVCSYHNYLPTNKSVPEMGLFTTFSGIRVRKLPCIIPHTRA